MKRMYKGHFITFEGGEGSGKTTQSKLLFLWLQQNQIATVLTREPGGSPAAEKIRKIVLDEALEIDPNTQLLLHCAARTQHVSNLIIPALLADKTVICDRFLDSTIAYQGYGQGLNTRLIFDIHKELVFDLMPDITFVLDMSIDQYKARKLIKDNTTDRYETMADTYHARVLEGFRTIADLEPKRCYLIDSGKSIEEIHSAIVKEVVKLQSRTTQ